MSQGHRHAIVCHTTCDWHHGAKPNVNPKLPDHNRQSASGDTYYVNTVTGERTWDRPTKATDDHVHRCIERNSGLDDVGQSSGPSSTGSELADGWERAVSNTTGAIV